MNSLSEYDLDPKHPSDSTSEWNLIHCHTGKKIRLFCDEVHGIRFYCGRIRNRYFGAITRSEIEQLKDCVCEGKGNFIGHFIEARRVKVKAEEE